VPFGSCAAFFRKTLQNSQSSLSKSFPGGCKWGVDVHKGTFQNRIFGSNPIGSCLSNLETSRGGDGSTLNVAGYEKKSGLFKSGWGPSWRSVWSMKPDPTAAGPAGASDDGVQDEIGGDCDARGDIAFSGNYIFPPGQDGNMFSFYYDNWLTPWSKGQYLAAYMAQWPTDRTLTVEPQK
jgi:acyl-homoserine lactone acylase PvdQ